MTNENIPALQYQRSPAKYAKGKVALHVPGIEGYKSTAAAILTYDILTRNTFSNRENAYIVSPTQADRFESAVEAVRVKWETPVLEDNSATITSDDTEPHAADCPYRHCGECLCGVADRNVAAGITCPRILDGIEECCKYGSPLPGETCDHCGYYRPMLDDIMLGDPDEYDESCGDTSDSLVDGHDVGDLIPEWEWQNPDAEPEPMTTSHTFIVDVQEFRAALNLAVAEKKPNIPVLGTVCLSPVGSTLQVISTDLDKSVITNVQAMIDDEAQPFLLPYRKAVELLKGETGILKITSSITIHSDKFTHAWVKLAVGDCEYDLESMNPVNFPLVPDIPEFSFAVPGFDLRDTIGRVIGCVSSQESRYTLNGALMEPEGTSLRVVATDGHRMAMDTISVLGSPTGKALIHRDSLAWLYKHSAGCVSVYFGEEFSSFQIEETTFTTRNVKGNFPNWQAVTPDKDSFNLTAQFPAADEFAKTLAKVARMADERSGNVKFAINGVCTISAQSCDTGKAKAIVKASINHSPDVSEIALGFNSSYVLEVLKIAGKNPVNLSLKDSQSAGVFTIPALKNYQFIVMSMRF